MSLTMNSEAYRQLLTEDLEWLDKQPRTLEREHIRILIESHIRDAEKITRFYSGTREDRDQI